MTATLSLRSPADLLAAVPYMLGFHPSDSVVLVGLRGQALVFQMRGDLPEREEVYEFAAYYARLVHRQRVDAVLLVGYGRGEAVTPILLATAEALSRRGISVPEMLRAHEGRYWSYLCHSVECCPPEGVRYDVSTNRVAAQATVSGCVALPSRTDLERRLAPVGGRQRDAMREATRQAGERLADLATRRREQGSDALVPAGRAAVDAAVDRYRAGGCLDDHELAWLSLLLGCARVRDYAWTRVGGSLSLHVSLWTDVLRRGEPGLAAPPATLLAFAAWRAGEGAIASIALARALRADPQDRMAQLLDHALRHGVSPAEWAAACDPEAPCTRSADSEVPCTRPAQE